MGKNDNIAICMSYNLGSPSAEHGGLSRAETGARCRIRTQRRHGDGTETHGAGGDGLRTDDARTGCDAAWDASARRRRDADGL